MGHIRQMYATSGTADAVASITMYKGQTLIGANMQYYVAASGADFLNVCELSQQSVSQATGNDVGNVIASVAIGADLTTSGVAPTAINMFFPVPDLKFLPGDRLYLHFIGTNITQVVRVHLYFREV
jgi:hypothetical protein